MSVLKMSILKSSLVELLKKSEYISVKGPKMWNDMPADIKLCKSMFTFKKM